MNNSKTEKRAIGSIIRVWLLTLLALTLCTCSGVRLMLGDPNSGKLTDYSTYSGKLVKQTEGVTACLISRTDVQVFRLWLQERRSTWPQYQVMHGLGYCPNLAPMRRKCSRIKSYPYLSIIRSFSNRYKTVWTDQRPNWPTEYRPRGSQENRSKTSKTKNYLRVSTQQSTGKTQGTTPMTGRN